MIRSPEERGVEGKVDRTLSIGLMNQFWEGPGPKLLLSCIVMAPTDSSHSHMIGGMLEEFCALLASKYKTFDVLYLNLF